jgi:predicted methyltransferase
MPKLLSILLVPLLAAQVVFADDAALQEAISGKHRTDAYRERDQYRHPLETLKLAPYLRAEGKLIAAHYDENDKQADYRPGSRQRFEKKLASDPAVYDKVEVTSLMFDESTDKLVLPAAKDGSVDRVVTFRNAHGWVSRGISEAAFTHFFAILKSGGKLGIVQHMADPEQDWMSRNIGYVGRDYIIAQATRAGFQLETEGFFNLNPKDNKRYEIGVWQLPPSLRGLETDAEKAPYRAIGESERMTLVFRKP